MVIKDLQSNGMGVCTPFKRVFACICIRMAVFEGMMVLKDVKMNKKMLAAAVTVPTCGCSDGRDDTAADTSWVPCE